MNARTNDLLNKLDQIARGGAPYDSATLQEVLRTFVLSPDERALIERFLFATHTGRDHEALAEFVRETRRNERPD
jgi:hypothetical protein